MPSGRERESRPQAATREPARTISTAIKTASSLADLQPTPPLAYVVIVTTTDARRRRRPYLSLHAAERAVERAEASGHVAALHLCRLEPVLPVLAVHEVGGAA